MKIYLSRIALCLIFINACPQILYAQQNRQVQERRGTFYTNETMSVIPDHSYHITAPQPFTSLTIRLAESTDFGNAYIIIKTDTFFLSTDSHIENVMTQSNLVVIDQESKDFQFYTDTIQGNIQIIYLNAGKTGKIEESQQRKYFTSDICDNFVTVPQNEWRSGLPAPNYVRSFNNVAHLIIHHSATSNSLTDYHNVVKNIYLYHTQVNGWSDIGYNYLVAPNGQIFSGRDPAIGEQDNVMGAHFCGKNSETMGICVLGDYRFAIPTKDAIQSLLHILTWKAEKENLIPLTFKAHPANAQLGTIAGHRDGCNTECPGQNLYVKIDSIKLETAMNLEKCENVQPFIIYNPVKSNLLTIKTSVGQLDELNLYDLQGKLYVLKIHAKENDGKISYNAAHLASGVYVLLLPNNPEIKPKKIIVF